MMSRSSAECRYSFGTGLKKCTPRLLMPRISLGGSRPMGSSAAASLHQHHQTQKHNL
jgi:hypothetical protein